jgi:cell division protein FtsQ
MTTSAPKPMDVKLMNTTATVLFLICAVMVLGALAGWASRHALFAIRGMVVTGEVVHNNAMTLRANVLPRLNGTFLTLDLTDARRAFESVPWVRQAVVRREFPNRLKVQLQEHHALAYWGVESESRLVNTFGEVFEANVGEVDDLNLPHLNGPDGQAARVLSMYQALQPAFELMDLALTQLELTAHGGWRARLDTGAVLELGRGDNTARGDGPLWPNTRGPGDRRFTASRWVCYSLARCHHVGGRCEKKIAAIKQQVNIWRKNTKIWLSGWTLAPPR